jgi:hypothetical protein
MKMGPTLSLLIFICQTSRWKWWRHNLLVPLSPSPAAISFIYIYIYIKVATISIACCLRSYIYSIYLWELIGNVLLTSFASEIACLRRLAARIFIYIAMFSGQLIELNFFLRNGELSFIRELFLLLLVKYTG